MSRFDDLEEENSGEESTAGDEALDGLADTVSGEQTGEEPRSTNEQEQTTSAADEVEEGDGYDPESDPAFPAVQSRTQHTIYCLPDTWETVDGSAGLLFDVEVRARREGMESVQKRELHNALLRAAAENLTIDDVKAALVETRQDRQDGELIQIEDDG